MKNFSIFMGGWPNVRFIKIYFDNVAGVPEPGGVVPGPVSDFVRRLNLNFEGF